jgi:hypothetical protein
MAFTNQGKSTVYKGGALIKIILYLCFVLPLPAAASNVLNMMTPVLAVSPRHHVDFAYVDENRTISYQQLVSDVNAEGYEMVDGNVIEPGQCTLAQADGSYDPQSDNEAAVVAVVCATGNDNEIGILSTLYARHSGRLGGEIGVVKGEIIVKRKVFGAPVENVFTLQGPAASACADFNGSDGTFCIGGDVGLVSASYTVLGPDGNGIEFGVGGKATFLISEDQFCIGYIVFTCIYY